MLRDASCIILYLLVAVYPGAAYSEPLSLATAEELALAHAPPLAIQRAVVGEVEGAHTQAGVLPNPTLSYQREDLDQAGIAGGEWSLAVTAPLDFVWERGPATRAASARVTAEKHTLDRLRARIRYAVRLAYLHLHAARERQSELANVAELFAEASQAADVRLDEGDISRYERHRITLEARRYARLASDASLQIGERLRELATYLGPKYASSDIETMLGPDPQPVRIDQTSAVSAGLNERSDLAAARAMSESADAAHSAERMRGYPPVSVSFGIKRQEDGFEGTMAGVEIGLPFFDRNQGKVKAANAVKLRRQIASDGLERRVRREITDAHQRYLISTRRFEDLARTDSVGLEILEAVRFAYAEGELSLVEFLDGLRAYHEAFDARLETEIDYRIAGFAMEFAVETPLDQLNAGNIPTPERTP